MPIFAAAQFAVLQRAQWLELKSRHLCRPFGYRFLPVSYSFSGVFMGFSRVLTVSGVSGARPQKQARRTSCPLRAAFSSPVLGTSAAPIHLVLVPKIWPGTVAWAKWGAWGKQSHLPMRMLILCTDCVAWT